VLQVPLLLELQQVLLLLEPLLEQQQVLLLLYLQLLVHQLRQQLKQYLRYKQSKRKQRLRR
jgi:hypothetical protein